MKILFLLFIALTPILCLGTQNSSVDDQEQGINRYFVAFISRESDGFGPGHAYVAWGVEDYEKQMSTGHAYGFYPQEGKEVWAIVREVGGNILNESVNAPKGEANNHLLLPVEKEVYDSTRKILESWVEQELQGNLTYDLIANNCIDFVNKVALAAGLDVPETHFQFPKEYLDRLIVMNSAAPNPPDFNVE